VRAACALVCIALAACSRATGRPSSAPKQAPAQVKRTEGSSIALLTLTPEAEGRLGLILAKVEERDVARTLTRLGIVERAQGSEITLRAPFAAVVRAPAAGELPKPGGSVRAGQALFDLDPLVSPSDRASLQKIQSELALTRTQASAAVERARVRSDAAEIALKRAEQLVASEAGSRRARDEALAERRSAQAELDAALAFERSLAALSIDDDPTAAARLQVVAPQDAQILAVTCTTGQAVAAGDALAMLARDANFWIRVPLPVGDLERVASDAPAAIGASIAQPIAAPPSADARAGTVDLWYELEGPAPQLRPGQRVDVAIADRASRRALVVPRSAVVYDAKGDAWVYARTAPQTFERRRVEIERMADDVAVLARGPAAGTEVAAQAAMELYGVEFGAGK
jgi:membrane fusion protein, heavy metal efflux system